MIKFYEYWRSSAAYRVRIALHLKAVPYESVHISLAPGDDQHLASEYSTLNPQKRVPSLDINGSIVGQSMAMIEWIDETYETGPRLVPTDPWLRLQARAFADTVACDIHPLNNLSVLKELRSTFGASEDAITTWYHDWIARGFDALELKAAEPRETAFLFGDTPTIAEIVLIPQIYNARRFNMDLSNFPNLMRLDAKCCDLAAFKHAAPEANKPI